MGPVLGRSADGPQPNVDALRDGQNPGTLTAAVVMANLHKLREAVSVAPQPGESLDTNIIGRKPALAGLNEAPTGQNSDVAVMRGVLRTGQDRHEMGALAAILVDLLVDLESEALTGTSVQHREQRLASGHEGANSIGRELVGRGVGHLASLGHTLNIP